jgi:RNA polymerase-binding transcription factor DksA
MSRQRINMRSLGKRIKGAALPRRLRQRQIHLRQIASYMRIKLKRAYPDGLPADHASHALSDGDELLAALKRYEDGCYGNCEDCLSPIPLLELWAKPHRRYCRICLSQRGDPPARKLRLSV